MFADDVDFNACRDPAGKFTDVRNMKRVTLKDIAARAGVSVALVSNYLNRHPSARMSKETKEKIDTALVELNYHCSDIARSLRTGRSHIIGYFTENLRNQVNQNEMIEIYDAAARENYRVIVGFSPNSGMILENIRAFIARGCDAVIISGYFPQHIVDQLAILPVPTVMLNTHDTASFPGKMLRYDYRTAVRSAIDHLKKGGHTGIYYMCGSAMPEDQRYSECIRNVSAENILHMPDKEFMFDQWYSMIKKHPDCTAILHMNDFLAMKTIQYASAAGIAVPDDLAVIGFDNIKATDYTVPTLSSIRRPLASAAEHAVKALLAELENKPYDLPETLPCEFIRRDSVKNK